MKSLYISADSENNEVVCNIFDDKTSEKPKVIRGEAFALISSHLDIFQKELVYDKTRRLFVLYNTAAMFFDITPSKKNVSFTIHGDTYTLQNFTVHRDTCVEVSKV